MFTVHCANNVTFAAPIVNVDPADLAVPDPFAAVFHPANVYPDRAIDPAPATVTAEPAATVCAAGGDEPPFASYVTVNCVAVAVNVTGLASARSGVAVKVCAPDVPRVHDVDARPPPLVITLCVPTLPPPAVTVKITGTPSTPFPAASRTTTLGFVGNVVVPTAV